MKLLSTLMSIAANEFSKAWKTIHFVAFTCILHCLKNLLFQFYLIVRLVIFCGKGISFFFFFFWHNLTLCFGSMKTTQIAGISGFVAWFNKLLSRKDNMQTESKYGRQKMVILIKIIFSSLNSWTQHIFYGNLFCVRTIYKLGLLCNFWIGLCDCVCN